MFLQVYFTKQNLVTNKIEFKIEIQLFQLELYTRIYV